MNVQNGSNLPLAGCVVVDASVYLAGPFAGLMLGDLGAEVVKLEPPKGDPLRRFGKRHNGVGVMFANMNRGKRRLAVDLKDGAGIDEFRTLTGTADVLIENWRPGVADRLGLTDGSLWATNPRLIHCSVTGFGHTGPRSRLPAFDTVVQALSGIAWFHSRDGRPQPLRTYLIDKLTGAFAAQAILAALLERERTGRGRRIDVDMLAAGAYFNFPDMFATRTAVDDDEVPDPESNPGANSVLPTRDGWILLAPTAGEHVKRSCEAAGHPEWVDELRSIRDTSALNPALMSRLASATVTGTTSHWVAAFEAADVPVAPALDLDGHLADPQVVSEGLYPQRDDPDLGPVRFARYPARFQ
ncbi:MAG: CaiB/BaiF CoA transferase family protein [Acidimicrobiia bacterium]